MTLTNASIATTVAIAATALALPTAASAEDFLSPRAEVSMQISHADLDLNSAAGAEALRKRVAKAAHRLCFQSINKGKLSISQREEATKCRDEAMRATSPQVELAIARAGTERLAAASVITVSRR